MIYRHKTPIRHLVAITPTTTTTQPQAFRLHQPENTASPSATANLQSSTPLTDLDGHTPPRHYGSPTSGITTLRLETPLLNSANLTHYSHHPTFPLPLFGCSSPQPSIAFPLLSFPPHTCITTLLYSSLDCPRYHLHITSIHEHSTSPLNDY